MREVLPADAPTFGSSGPTPFVRLGLWLWRPRVRRVWIVVLALIVAAGLWQSLFVNPALTASRYELRLVGEDSGPTILVDDETGAVEVRDAQLGLTHFVVAGGRLLAPEELLDPTREPGRWISMPLDATVGNAAELFTPQRVEELLRRSVKQCEPPNAGTDRIIKLTVVQRFQPGDSRLIYNVCGGGTGNAFDNDVNVVVRRTHIPPGDLDTPTPDEITAVESLGDEGEQLTGAARAAFAESSPGL